MANLHTLLFTGGGVHDWKGCGAVLKEHLDAVPDFDVTHVEDDLDIFVSPEVNAFDSVAFYYTVGEISDHHLLGLLRFVTGGKGFVGIHGATASFKQCDEYRAMIGGYLVGHPGLRPYMVSVVDPEHPITQGLSEFVVTDEQYTMNYDPRVSVLANALYQGEPHPVVWTKNWGQGRVVYLAQGHNPDCCRDSHLLLMLERSLRWSAQA